jgi:NitT/TauT family transport system ATP-binding protein
MVELQDVHKRFGWVEVLRGFSMRVNRGQTIAIIGPSGSGKSTLLRVVAGLLSPDRGQVAIDGREVRGPDPAVGIVFQEHRLLAWRGVASNIGLPLEIAGWSRADRRTRIAELVGLVGLEGYETARPVELSGGLRQRAAIARALALRPSVLLLDEPFSALDALTRERFDAEIRDLAVRAGTTVLLVTHSIPEAVLVADRVAVLSPRPGRIVGEVPIPRSAAGPGRSGMPAPGPAGPDEAAFGDAAAQVRAFLEAGG